MASKNELDPYQQKALEMVLAGDSLFVSGKAGVGKSYLLKNCIVPAYKAQGKNVAVLAPTGIAAQNIGGDTIHSFFHLPTAPYLPGHKNSTLYDQTFEQIKAIKCLDLLIIDEISMVRCDVFDAIDDIMRHHRKSDEPFGGVQIVLFGDLYQLMPVATEEDEELLKKKYKSDNKEILRKHECYFFFMSRVYKRMVLPMLELERIHRQQDDVHFTNILNKVRLGSVGDDLLEELNDCLTHNVDKEKSIRLCSLNKTAWGYNQGRLEELGSYIKPFYGTKEGEVYHDDLPTDTVVNLSVGARVMIIRNDTNGHRYVNGTRGVIKRLNGYSVDVETDDGDRIEVERCKWYFYRYYINPVTKKLEQRVRGSFEQIPLKLAWAITVHKSQGLTLDDMVLDASRTFADGQLYVALSRAHHFHKMQFATKIIKSYVKTNPDVALFMKNVEKIPVDVPEKAIERKPLDTRTAYSNKVLSMALSGLSIDEMVKREHTRQEVIYNDLAKLVELGKVDVKAYVSSAIYNAIDSTFSEFDLDLPLTTFKASCPKGTKFGEIRMVIADLKRRHITSSNNVDKGTSKPKDSEKGRATTSATPKIQKAKETLLEKVKSTKKTNKEETSNFVRLSVMDETINYLLGFSAPIYKKAIITHEAAVALTTNPDYYNRMYLINCPLIAKRLEKAVFLTKSKKTYKADIISITFSRASGKTRDYWVADMKLKNLHAV